MKASPMEVSPIAYNLITDFNEWLEESSKVGYRFSEEEQMYLQKMVIIMENQLDMLIKYELERKESEK